MRICTSKSSSAIDIGCPERGTQDPFSEVDGGGEGGGGEGGGGDGGGEGGGGGGGGGGDVVARWRGVRGGVCGGVGVGDDVHGVVAMAMSPRTKQSENEYCKLLPTSWTPIVNDPISVT